MNQHQIELATGAVHRFVSQRVVNVADADDITQETLLIGCTKLHTFRGTDVRPWLLAIADGLIEEYDRARNEIDIVGIDPAADDEKESALRIPAETVVARCEVRQRVGGWLRRCSQLLDPGQQVAVLLADVYDYCDKDSAGMLKMSVPSFKLFLHRSRLRLKEFDRVADGAPVAVRRRRAGVVCRLGAADLRMLRRRLVDGIRGAVALAFLLSDFVDLDLLDVLFDM